jgi:hypothetical protein
VNVGGLRVLLFWLVVAIVAVQITAAWIALGPVGALKTEGAGAEQASATALFAAFLIFSVDRFGAGEFRSWHVALLLAVLALRELDLDKRLFADGMLKLRFYTGGEAPLWQKVIGGAVIVTILAALWRLYRRQFRGWWAALRARAGWAWVVLAAFLLGAVAKSLDGLGRKLAPLGISFDDDLDLAFGLAEETLELVFALALVLAVCIAPRVRSVQGAREAPDHNAKPE